jgi:hypothetical protein
MKIIFCLLVVLVFTACGTPQMTSGQQNVAPISDTTGCTFIKTAYFEVSHPSRMHYYAAKNVDFAGGDSYKILQDGQDMAVRQDIYTFNIGIYECKSPPKPSKPTEPPKQKSSVPPEKSELPPKLDLRYLSEEDSDVEEESEEASPTSYIDELKALAELRDDGIITEDEFQKQKADILARH